MKRHLHFYQWFLCLLLFAGSSIAAYSQGRVMSLDELKAGSINKIYPVGGGVTHWKPWHAAEMDRY